MDRKKCSWRTVIGAIAAVTLAISVIYAIVMAIISPSGKKSHYVIIALECLFGILAVILPGVLDRKWSFGIPDYVYTTYFIFLYCAIFLGSVLGFYSLIPQWDTILHAISGAMLGVLGFCLVSVCNRSEKIPVNLTPFFVALFAFCFALAVGAVWEIYEYTGDGLLGMNMQRFNLSDGTALQGRAALYDTMKDIIVDAISALIVAIIGYFPTKKAYVKASRKKFVIDVTDDTDSEEQDDIYGGCIFDQTGSEKDC